MPPFLKSNINTKFSISMETSIVQICFYLHVFCGGQLAKQFQVVLTTIKSQWQTPKSLATCVSHTTETSKKMNLFFQFVWWLVRELLGIWCCFPRVWRNASSWYSIIKMNVFDKMPWIPPTRSNRFDNGGHARGLRAWIKLIHSFASHRARVLHSSEHTPCAFWYHLNISFVPRRNDRLEASLKLPCLTFFFDRSLFVQST